MISRRQFVSAVALSGAAAALPSAASGVRAATRVDEIMRAVVGKTVPGAAVAVLQDKEVVLERAWGVANLDQRFPYRPSTLFPIASMSKQFTAFCVLHLAADGKLSLDDDVRKHLPEFQGPTQVIRIRDLCHQTSGIRDYLFLGVLAGHDPDAQQSAEFWHRMLVEQRTLHFSPGDRYDYSNSNFALLQRIVERHSGRSLDAFAKEQIFGPLGMKHSSYGKPAGVSEKDIAVAYLEAAATGFVRSPWNDKHAPEGQGGGASGIWSSVDDLIRWERNFTEPALDAAITPKLLGRQSLNNGVVNDYACGIMTGEYRGLRWEGHGGADPGQRCERIRFPERKVSVIVSLNGWTEDPFTLALRIADVYLGFDGVADRGGSAAVAAFDTERFERYLGSYHDAARLSVATLELDNRRPKLKMNGVSLPLAPDGKGRLAIPAGRANSLILELRGTEPAPTIAMSQGGSDFLPLTRAVHNTIDAGELVGCYYSSELKTTFQIAKAGGGLVLDIAGPQGGPRGLKLVAVDGDRYDIPGLAAYGYGFEVWFQRGEGGVVDRLLANSQRAHGVRYERVQTA